MEGIHSSTILLALHRDETVPAPYKTTWATDKSGVLTKTDAGARKLAQVLKTFGCAPTDVRHNGVKSKGYKRSDLELAIKTYLPNLTQTLSSEAGEASEASQDSSQNHPRQRPRHSDELSEANAYLSVASVASLRDAEFAELHKELLKPSDELERY